MSKILIIEDDKTDIEFYRLSLETMTNLSFTFATTFDEAETEVRKGGWDVIVLDACLNTKGHVDSYPLIPIIKECCGGKPIIANSSKPDYRTEFIAMGCTHDSGGKAVMLDVLMPLLA